MRLDLKNLGVIISAITMMFGGGFLYQRWSEPIIQYTYHHTSVGGAGVVNIALVNRGHRRATDIGVVVKLKQSFDGDSLTGATILGGDATQFREPKVPIKQVKYTLPFDIRPQDRIELWIKATPGSADADILAEPPVITAGDYMVLTPEQFDARSLTTRLWLIVVVGVGIVVFIAWRELTNRRTLTEKEQFSEERLQKEVSKKEAAARAELDELLGLVRNYQRIIKTALDNLPPSVGKDVNMRFLFIQVQIFEDQLSRYKRMGGRAE